MDFRAQAARMLAGVWGAVRSGATKIGHEAALTFDLGRWQAATNWGDRAAAVSWPRASAAGVLTMMLAGSVWLLLQSDPRPQPPRLPTDQEWRANQAAAAAMDAKLSPALAAANRTAPVSQ